MKTTLNAKVLLLALSIAALAPLSAQATDDVACDTSCNSGDRMISYSDGNSVTCACVAEGQMEPTVADPSVVEGTITEDTE